MNSTNETGDKSVRIRGSPFNVNPYAADIGSWSFCSRGIARGYQTTIFARSLAEESTCMHTVIPPCAAAEPLVEYIHGSSICMQI